jgi:SAM-dependent methyltransferase
MVTPDPLQHALDAIAASPRPLPPWPEGHGIPWGDPEFSERALQLHLDPSTHMASRAPDVIARHGDWLVEQLDLLPPVGRPRRVLEVGCGPGLYCFDLARRGVECVGFDIAPAPLRHAREVDEREGHGCRFLTADLNALPDDFAQRIGPVDAVTFWFGDLHGFPPAVVRDFLPKLAACVGPHGLMVLEIQPLDEFEPSDATAWNSSGGSVFCPGPHLWLQEWFWHEAANVEVHVHWIIDRDSGSLTRYVQCHQGWPEEELVGLLAEAGLTGAVLHPPITGVDEQYEFPVLVTRKEPMNPTVADDPV